MAMSGAERQKRHRDKIVKKLKEQTLEQAEKEERRVKERCCDMVYQLGGTNYLYAIEALLRCLTYHGIETEEQKKAKIMDMSSYVKALVDVDIEIADGTWDTEGNEENGAPEVIK